MNHQSIIEQLSSLAPQLKAAASPESVLVKYASERNLSPAQLERIGQVYNIAKTLNFMDKSANRGDSFKVLDTEKMLADFTSHKPKEDKQAFHNTDWNSWFDTNTSKAASTSSIDPDNIDAWVDRVEKAAKIVKEDGKYVVYSGDGSKRLSKPGTKEEAVKRLRQVEYFKKHKEAGTMPNLMGMALNEDYTSIDDVPVEEVNKTASQLIKDELRGETLQRFEIETAKQIASDAREEVIKIANELLEMHRLSNLPFAQMEHDAVYCSQDTEAIKSASDFLANYFANKGWTLERHDFNKAPARLVRDRYNVLPLFKSAAENINLFKAASAYSLEVETGSARDDKPEKKRRDDADIDVSGYKKNKKRQDDEDVEINLPQRSTNRRPAEAAPDVISELDLIKLVSDRSKDKKEEKSNRGDSFKQDLENVSNVAKGLKSIYSPETYLNKQTQDFLDNVLKAPSLSSTNKAQKKVDIAAEDVGRVSDLQRLLLSDPIIGEADPDTVVSLYNTLAKANPEVVKDRNLLRFALREALQYDAVPLHTYKDLISMGKDRADTLEKLQKFDENRYKI
jgi:hypothetical protein